MLTPRPGRTWLASSMLAGAAVACVVALGCAEDPTETGRALPTEVAGEDPGETAHLGRIHLTLTPLADELEPEPGLQINARFVEYRGVSEEFVRARSNLPVPAWEQLVLGQCVASESLLPLAEPQPDDELRDVSMIDAGDLRITLGSNELVTPLGLVPDLLPWLSGVEYVHVDDRIPRYAVDPDGTSPVVVSVDGSPDGVLEGFGASVVVPVPLRLQAAKISHGRLTIDWRPPDRGSKSLILRLQAFRPTGTGDEVVSEPIGEELTCLVADTGRARLAVAPLTNAGLATDAGVLRVSASRFDVERVSAGNFGEVEVFVELRAQRTLILD